MDKQASDDHILQQERTDIINNESGDSGVRFSENCNSSEFWCRCFICRNWDIDAERVVDFLEVPWNYGTVFGGDLPVQKVHDSE